MKQYFKSAFLVAGIAVAAAFTPAAAASHVTLPFSKTFTTDNANGFSVQLDQNEENESVHFSVRNHTGAKLRCTLKGPDGSILESVYVKAKTGESVRNYLFDSAEEGTYSIEVTDGKEKIVKQIDLRHVKTVSKASLTIR